MTNEQKVRVVYPDVKCSFASMLREYPWRVYLKIGKGRYEDLGAGRSEKKAWADAASRLSDAAPSVEDGSFERCGCIWKKGTTVFDPLSGNHIRCRVASDLSPIAEPAKAPHGPHYNEANDCHCENFANPACKVCFPPAAPQPVIDDAKVVNKCPWCKIHSLIREGDREYCSASWCNYLKIDPPTPTVIPDAKDEPLILCPSETHDDETCTCTPAVRKAIKRFKDKLSESKPLPSEPTLQQIEADINGQFAVRLMAFRKDLDAAGLHGHYSIFQKHFEHDIKFTEPSEPASMTSARSSYLLVCGDADKEPSAFDAFESGWNAAKAEKVEESWPEAVVSDDLLQRLVNYYQPTSSTGATTILDVAKELQAYRELKKRSVGGVK